MKRLIDWFRQSPSLGFVVLAFSCFGVALLSVFLLAFEYHHPTTPRKEIVGHTCVRKKIDSLVAEYPELLWLIGAEEGIDSLPTVFACLRSFGKPSSPFDHAIKGMLSVDTFIDGEYADYLELVSVMHKEYRLSWEHFLSSQKNIQLLIDCLFQFTKKELIQVFKTYIVFAELGNSKHLRAKAWVYGVSKDDHRELFHSVLKEHPEMFPSFSRLNLEQKELLLKLLTSAPFERLFYFTSVYQIMEKFKADEIVKEQPDLFEMLFFLHQCRVSSRDSHSDQLASIGFNERLYNHHQLFRRANYIASKSTLREGYDYYLSNRAEWLGFDLSTTLDRTLTFVGSLLDCYSSVEGELLKETFLALHPNDISFLVNEIEGLSTDRDDTYRNLACVLANLKKNPKLGRSMPERLVNTISLSVPFLSKSIFLDQSSMNRTSDPLNFSDVISIAFDDPELLKVGNITVQDNGFVKVEKR